MQNNTRSLKTLPSYAQFPAMYDIIDHLYIHRYQIILEATGDVEFDYMPDDVRDKLLLCLSKTPVGIGRQAPSLFSLIQSGAMMNAQILGQTHHPERKGYTLSYLSHVRKLEKGSTFPFELTLVGDINRLLSFWIKGIEMMAAEGLGKNATPFRLIKINEIGAGERHSEIPLNAKESYRPCLPIKISDFAQAESNGYKLHLRMLSPTLIGKKGTDMGIGLVTLTQSILSMYIDWAVFFCQAPAEQYQAAGIETTKFCQQINTRLSEQNTRWKYYRLNAKGRKPDWDIGGCTGFITWEGKFNRLMPLLKMAEHTQIGEHLTFGMGLVRFDS